MKRIPIKERLIVPLVAAAGLILFTFSFQRYQDTSNLLFHVSLASIGSAGLYYGTKLTFKQRRMLPKRFLPLSEIAKEGLLIHNQGIVYEVNNALTKIIGYSKEEIIGKNILSAFVHPEDHSLVYQKMKMQNSEPYEVRIIRKDKTTIIVELHSYITHYQGKTYRVVSIRDITEQKKLEERLRIERENFNNFFYTIDDMIFIGNKHGNILFVNDGVTRKLGYTFNELLEMNILDVHPANKRNEAQQIFSEMFEGKRDFCPLPFARKDGSIVPVETRIWFGKWGGKDCIFGVSKDIS